MDVPVGGCLKQKTAFRRERKREKVAAGPEPSECKAGYEAKYCGELRVRWTGLVGRWEVGQGRASRGVLETELVLQKLEKERERGGCVGIRDILKKRRIINASLLWQAPCVQQRISLVTKLSHL